MAEKAIERYAGPESAGSYTGNMRPDHSGEWMRYDAELVRDALRYRWLAPRIAAIELGADGQEPKVWQVPIPHRKTDGERDPRVDTAIDTAISHSGRAQG